MNSRTTPLIRIMLTEVRVSSTIGSPAGLGLGKAVVAARRNQGGLALMAAADQTVRLVLGVARLGEDDLAGWWSTHGLDRSGRYVLSRSFRRTWRSAALELDVEAAARRHQDATSGRRTALHLFSDELPFRRWAMSWLAEQKTAPDVSSLFDELAGWDLGTARATITDWAGCPPTHEVVGEGLRLGTLTRAETEDLDTVLHVAGLLAASYVSSDGPFRVPYFDLHG
jgi:hypothetical protein